MKRQTSFGIHNLTYNIPIRAFFMPVVLLLSVLMPCVLNAEAITYTGGLNNSIIQTIEANQYQSGYGVDMLLSTKAVSSTKFDSGMPVPAWTDPAYIEITLKDGGLSASDDDFLVVYTRRVDSDYYSVNKNDHPIAFHVKGEFGGNWIDLFNIYFLYRGRYTEEFSSKIPIEDIWKKYSGTTGHKMTKMRFYIIATNGNFATDTKHIQMAMNRFDVLKLGPDDTYSDKWADNNHLTTDYRKDLYGYKFRHTQGIFDPVNSVDGWERISDSEKADLKNNYGIEIPEFEIISNSSTKNKPICTLEPGQELQPTHEVKHILYAMPGDVINLYPYYELYHTYQFYENFSHWYDYRTGGRLKYNAPWDGKNHDLLDFLTDPEKIQITENEGFFAGYGMAGVDNVREYTITSVDDYINAVTEINSHKEFSSIKFEVPSKILDFSGKTNVPMLGDGYAFKGMINGNGTTIKNLKYEKTGQEGVGLIGKGGGSVVVTNLILDETCVFAARNGAGGIVGYLESGSLNVSNIKTAAHVYGTKTITYPDGNTFPDSQNAAGILGISGSSCSAFKISNCYIGGTIGDMDKKGANNAAVVGGWLGSINSSSLTNIVVKCNLIGAENQRWIPEAGDVPTFSHYVRYNNSHVAIDYTENEFVKTRGGIVFDHCYGDLQPTDECWKPLEYSSSSLPADANTKLTDWNLETMTPPMSSASTNYTYKVGTEAEYKDVATKINSGVYASNITIELTSNLNFNYATDIPMIGTFDRPFTGKFNGNGHTVRKLKIDYSNSNAANDNNNRRIGMFGTVNGATIENLIVDKTCEFKGNSWVALIGGIYGGGLTIKNIKTEATIESLNHDWVASAAGILGMASNSGADNYINLSDVYIGGEIKGGSNNRAIVGYLDCKMVSTLSHFNNVVIDCEIKNPASSGTRLVNYSNPEMASFSNCYANGIDDNNPNITPFVSPMKKMVDEWQDAETPAMTGKINTGYNLKAGDTSDHQPGTVATFFCPKNPFGELYQSLPIPENSFDEQKEYIIAADFSKTFDIKKHLDIENNTLSEPVIAFRHIFRIRDGKDFADNNFGTYTGNRDYVRRNQKIVSARSSVPFQIRLTTPVPTEKGTSVPTNIYYKKSENEYGRVSGKFEIILLDGDTRKEIGKGDSKYSEFYFGDEFSALGVREIDGVNYSFGDGNNKFSRMLKCDNPKPDSHYIVQLVATEDYTDSNKRINAYIYSDDSNNFPSEVPEDKRYLIVAEYNIRFLPLKGATMLTMDALYDDEDEYINSRVETLEEKFGSPIDVINFDEYININTINDNLSLRDKLISANATKDFYGNDINPDNNQTYKLSNPGLYHTYFKWPIPWKKANYAYGFNKMDGYNMYMLTTHSDLVAYRQAVFLRDYFTYGAGTTPDHTDKTALSSKDNDPVQGNRNADNHGKGLYDVKYYRSKRKIDEYYKMLSQPSEQPSTRAEETEVPTEAPKIEQGYFYWGNAASDPGVATRLEINDLCPGSTIHVSAWVAEFSIDKEASNLSFNFVAVMKTDYPDLGVKAGDRIVLHSFVTGYVPDGGKFYYNRGQNNDGSMNTSGMYHWVYNPINGYYDINYLSDAFITDNANKGRTTTTDTDKDMRGQWLNVYYSFVPRLAEFNLSGIDKDDVYYELELDNNAKSSEGADFGIDDIRIYLEPPMVDARQVKPSCKNESVRIRMTSPFETLLEIAGASETLSKDAVQQDDLAVYYTFIDKSSFDTKVAKYKMDGINEGTARLKAFKESVIKFSYNRDQANDNQNNNQNEEENQEEEILNLYGKVTFSSRYESNRQYPEGVELDDGNLDDPELNPFGVGFYRTDKNSGERLIIFESDVAEKKFTEGNQYYVVLKTSEGDIVPEDFGGEGKKSDPEENIWDFFDMFSDCANKNVINIKGAVIIRVNGDVVASDQRIAVCENQSPIIQVNVRTTDLDENFTVEAKDMLPFDWYYGLSTDFKGINDGDPEHTLEYALQVFRSDEKRYYLVSADGVFPDPEETEETENTENTETGGESNGNTEKKEKLKQWMIDIIRKHSTKTEQNPNPKLLLAQKSATIPPIKLGEGQDSALVTIVAIPIAYIMTDSNKMVCSDLTEIPIIVKNKAPILKHGLTYLNYPSNMTDVPLRIGLDQIRTDMGTEQGFSMKQIAIPVREAATSKNSKATELVLTKETRDNLAKVNGTKPGKEQMGCIVLTVTDDPEYSSLDVGDHKPEQDKKLLWIGEVTKLVATPGENNKEGNVFHVTFYDDFIFKEGYTYSMRFDYSDNDPCPPVDESESENNENTQELVCQGQDTFTMYIVPKYLLWNGGVTDKTNLNWNNDNNWSRLDHDEIHSDDDKKDGEYRHYVTDAVKDDSKKVNDNTSAFAPLDFTYVVIKDNVEAPYLYAPKSTQDFTNNYNLKDKENNQLIYHWPKEPEKDDAFNYQDDPGAYKIGEPSALIKYDMAAFDFEEGKGPDNADTGCRPWYANTCKEIHFKPGGTIMNQQELIYEKAWVDVELNHSRWYTLSSPLKEVYAGDFYLPTAGARQETELYQPITFDNAKNHRFKPAVFQRGWDKSTAKVYELEKQGLDKFRNVAVKTFWSHVYNDVTEQYGGGVGFSIKTDVSKLEDPIRNNKVMFRLPKDDDFYDYYNQSGTTGHHTTITRTTNRYKLNPGFGKITATTVTEGYYFLVGNPFMTHMDIDKFIKANESLLQPVYWVVTEKGQIAGSVSETHTWTASASSADETAPTDPTVIAPMQGFFVKSKTAQTDISLNYNESMMRRYANGNYLTETTRSEEGKKMLRISAENYGEPSSAALLVPDQALTGMASDVEAIDNRDLDVLSTVYTVKDGQAMSINFCNEPEGVEIGVIADDDTETLLRFEGVEAVEGLSLLDKTDRSLTPLEEGMVVTVKGSAAGRFFLTYGIADEGVLSGIDFSVNGTTFTATDNAASGFLEVKVYDTMGHMVKTAASDSGTLSVQLNSGIYIVEMTTVKERKTAKIRIAR